MLIQVSKWESVDTADLTPEERHILQKLFLWESSVQSLGEFRAHVDRALALGWNNSGPVSRSRNLDRSLTFLEKKVTTRLGEKN